MRTWSRTDGRPREPVVWRGLTNAGRRHVRDRRLAAYQSFGHDGHWSVLGLADDLSRRYPVAPLIGASSAQVELALAGRWADRPAVVASVLVQADESKGWLGHRTPDRVVQLTALDTEEHFQQFTATCGSDGWQVAMLARSGSDEAEHITRLLLDVTARGELRTGDHMAADGRALLHTRPLGAFRGGLDIEGPLRALSHVATALGSR